MEGEGWREGGMEGEGEREHLGGAVGPEAVVGAAPHLEGAPAVAVLGERQHHDVDLGGQHERRGQPRRRGAQVRLDDPALRGGGRPRHDPRSGARHTCTVSAVTAAVTAATTTVAAVAMRVATRDERARVSG
eukprot:SAG25_NODE_800_length_5271_cov_4.461524_9_plen_132_part_00